MTNPPSLESCQQLHKLAPGWTDTERWYTPLSTGEIVVTDWQKATRVGMNRSTPLYDTDYLLDKLPKFSPDNKDCYLTLIKKSVPKDKKKDIVWTAGYSSGSGWSWNAQATTPTEALIRLAITLIQEGKLKP